MPTELQDAIDTLTNGHELREMTRHNAADFVQATAVVVEAARRVADAQKAMTLHHQQDLNDDLRRAIGRGKFAPFEGDIERLLNVCDTLLGSPPSGISENAHAD